MKCSPFEQLAFAASIIAALPFFAAGIVWMWIWRLPARSEEKSA